MASRAALVAMTASLHVLARFLADRTILLAFFVFPALRR
jgi:hypothetical protein